MHTAYSIHLCENHCKVYITNQLVLKFIHRNIDVFLVDLQIHLATVVSAGANRCEHNNLLLLGPKLSGDVRCASLKVFHHQVLY